MNQTSLRFSKNSLGCAQWVFPESKANGKDFWSPVTLISFSWYCMEVHRGGTKRIIAFVPHPPPLLATLVPWTPYSSENHLVGNFESLD